MIDISNVRPWNFYQNTNGNIGKVIGFDADSMGFLVVMQYHPNSTSFSRPNMLLPLPLTEAILEKSGWQLKDGIWVKYGPIRVGWRPHSKELIMGYHTLPFAVEFVSQLQNLLTDYGLNDDIVV